MTQKVHESSPPLLFVAYLHCGDAVYVPPTPNAGKGGGAALDVGGDEIKKSLHGLSRTKTTGVGISLLNSHNQSSVCPTAAPVEAALGALWPPCWRWEWGGGWFGPDAL